MPCRPLTITSEIEERLDVVDLFMAHTSSADLMQHSLSEQPDAERLLPKAAAALRALQEEQQQRSQQHQQQGLGSHSSDADGACGALGVPDSCSLDARRAAWKVLMVLPPCLMG